MSAKILRSPAIRGARRRLTADLAPTYRRPDTTSTYRRPDSASIYKRP